MMSWSRNRSTSDCTEGTTSRRRRSRPHGAHAVGGGYPVVPPAGSPGPNGAQYALPTDVNQPELAWVVYPSSRVGRAFYKFILVPRAASRVAERLATGESASLISGATPGTTQKRSLTHD